MSSEAETFTPFEMTITGNDDDNLIFGSDRNDLLLGENGNDILHGGDGDDILIGGPGRDQFFGGQGADEFIFYLEDIDGGEEIKDFSPEEGDSVILQLPSSHKSKKKLTSQLDDGTVAFDLGRSTITHKNVKVSLEGDLEVRFEGEKWERLVRLNQSRLKVKIDQQGDRVKLTFDRKF